MNQYQEFHQLKKQIINKLISIEDGARMSCYAQNFLEDQTNAEAYYEAVELMAEANKVVEQLAKSEKGNNHDADEN